MAWAPVNRSVFTHRKTMKLADILDIPEVYAVGHLVAFWTWAMDNAPDGIIPEGTSARMIARASEYPGNAQSFLDALIESQYLVDMEEGLTIPNWMEYGGKLLERQEKDAARKRAGRAKDVRVTSAGCPQDVRRMSGVEENRVEENRREERGVEAPKPPLARNADAFMDGVVHKAGTLDLKAILADRPHWAQWLEANRPAPKAGKTTEGYDRWQVCRWLNG